MLVCNNQLIEESQKKTNLKSLILFTNYQLDISLPAYNIAG